MNDQPNTKIDLAAIKARAEAATNGPWEADLNEVSQHFSRPEPWLPIVSTEVSCMAYCYGGAARGILSEADAEFIAHARTDVPALVAEIERLRRERDELGERLRLARDETKSRHRNRAEKAEGEVERLWEERDATLVTYARMPHRHDGACLEPEFEDRDPHCGACSMLPHALRWHSTDGEHYPTREKALAADEVEAGVQP